MISNGVQPSRRFIYRFVKGVLGLLLAITLTAGIVAAFFYLQDALQGVNQPYQPLLDPHPLYPELGGEWQMHPLDNPGDWLANGLDPADLNGDGWSDFLINYEFNGRIRVAFHPGANALYSDWHAQDVGFFANAESAAWGDFDGDGIQDIVVAHGVEHTRTPPGLRILWGSQEIEKGSLQFHWQDGGDLPASRGGWQFLTVKSADLDNDGDLDIVAGGRASRVAGGGKDELDEHLTWAGLRWFANPGDGRFLEGWLSYPIDPHTPSGHGFELADIDGDGFLDLVNANADWDTLEEDENLAWYANPDNAHRFDQPWQGQVIYRSSEFFGKEQVVVVDLDQDGWLDMLIQSEKVIHWFRGGQGNTFHDDPIPKQPAAQWIGRTLEAADLNRDGRLDIIGALIHNNGRLPKDKAAVFWMEQTSADWQMHVIKWGDGFWGLGTFNGEKWDQIVPYDVDGDGDLDLAANCEEYNRLRAIISVVWFENPHFSSAR